MADAHLEGAQPRAVHAASCRHRNRLDSRRAGRRELGHDGREPDERLFYVLSINVPSIYKLSARAARAAAPARRRARRRLRQARWSPRGASVPGAVHRLSRRGSRGVGTYPSLVDVTSAIGPETLREVITGGRQACRRNVMTGERDGRDCWRFWRQPGAAAGAAAGAEVARLRRRSAVRWSRPVERRAHAQARARGGGGMVGTAVPARRRRAGPRATTRDYGMDEHAREAAVLHDDGLRPEYRTIKWQVPAGGDEPRAVAEGGRQTRDIHGHGPAS